MSFKRRINKRDGVAAGLLCILGLGVVLYGSSYSMGTLARMGPGFFPVMLGILLVILGILSLLSSGVSAEADEEEDSQEPAQWRGWCGIVGGVIAFMILGKYGGLGPATFALVFISALGDRTHTWRSAAILALFVAVVGTLIFSWGLDLRFPIFRWG